MKRGIFLFLIILLLNPIAFSTNLNNQDELTEKDLIESCKFKSSGPDVVLQKTQYNSVLIWLYEPDKEKFGDLILASDVEKISENKYGFMIDSDAYVVEGEIPDLCERLKETNEQRESVQTVHIDGKCNTASANIPGDPSAKQCSCFIEQEIDDPKVLTNPVYLNEIMPYVQTGRVYGTCPTPKSWDIVIAYDDTSQTDNLDDTNEVFTAEQQIDISKGLEVILKKIIEFFKTLIDFIVNFVNNLANTIFPKQGQFECDSRTINDITDSSIFTKDSITITNQKEGSVSFEYDKCSDDKVEEIYCKQEKGNSKDDVVGYKELLCSNGCKDGVCIHPPIDLGYIKISGAVGNGIPFIGGPRLKAYGNLNADLNLDSTGKFCGYYEYDSTVKLWVHKDLYKLKYDSLVKKESDDLFDKKALMPKKDFGSFVALIHTYIRDGIAVMEVEYKKASDNMPSDLENYGMSDATKPESIKIPTSKEVAEYQMKNKVVLTFLELYNQLLARGTIGVQEEPPKYEGNLVSDSVKKQVEGISSDGDQLKKDLNEQVKPLIIPIIDRPEYQEKIKEACGN